MHLEQAIRLYFYLSIILINIRHGTPFLSDKNNFPFNLVNSKQNVTIINISLSVFTIKLLLGDSEMYHGRGKVTI